MVANDEGQEAAARECARMIRFPLGLPGFPGATRFTLQQPALGPEPLLLMRSADDPSVRFLVLPCAGDALPMNRAELETACERHGLSPDEVTVLLIVSGQSAESGCAERGLCANRRAPILLDTGRAIAVQHVLDNPDYAIRWPLTLAA
jgi:flagellar assembly factor FliW